MYSKGSCPSQQLDYRYVCVSSEIANAKTLGTTLSIYNDRFMDGCQMCFQTGGWLTEIRGSDGDTVLPDTSIPEEPCACVVRVEG